jgi:hypothetical protein
MRRGGSCHCLAAINIKVNAQGGSLGNSMLLLATIENAARRKLNVS